MRERDFYCELQHEATIAVLALSGGTPCDHVVSCRMSTTGRPHRVRFALSHELSMTWMKVPSLPPGGPGLSCKPLQRFCGAGAAYVRSDAGWTQSWHCHAAIAWLAA
jgi:hypothetical protein